MPREDINLHRALQLASSKFKHKIPWESNRNLAYNTKQTKTTSKHKPESQNHHRLEDKENHKYVLKK